MFGIFKWRSKKQEILAKLEATQKALDAETSKVKEQIVKVKDLSSQVENLLSTVEQLTQELKKKNKTLSEVRASEQVALNTVETLERERLILEKKVKDLVTKDENRRRKKSEYNRARRKRMKQMAEDSKRVLKGE